MLKRHLSLTVFALLLIFSATTIFASTKKTSNTTNMSFQIEGIDDYLLKNTEERLRIFFANTGKLDRQHAQQYFKAGKKEVLAALEPFSYYDPTITGSLTTSDGKWIAHYQVQKGKPILIDDVSIDVEGPGKRDPKILKAIESSPLTKGKRLIVPDYQKTKIDIMNAARSAGYLDARFAKDHVSVNLIHYQSEVQLLLLTGPRFYFGPVSLNKTPLSPVFLKRFLNFKPGEPFDPQKLTDLQSTYAGTGYFRSVSITPEKNKAKTTHKVPVKLNFDMNKKHMYQIGLGYGTVSGIRLSSAINWRYIGAYGNKFNLSGTWSRTYYNLTAQYLIPAINPVTSYYTINASAFILEPNTGKALVGKFGPGYLWQYQKWTFEGYLYYLAEKWRLNDAQNYRNSHLIQPMIQATRLSTNNIVRVENGSRYTFILSGAYRGLYSTATYLEPQFNFKGIKTLGVGNRFVFGLQTGLIAGNEYDRVPLSERFFAGGDGSILGFDYQDIGPGRYLTVANLAYQRKVYGDFYGEVFYDIGNAFVKFNNYKHDLNRTSGLGVVWRTPVGDLTVYWAKILSKPGQPNQFGFTLGPEL